jgi:hypothetical protein
MHNGISIYSVCKCRNQNSNGIKEVSKQIRIEHIPKDDTFNKLRYVKGN